MKQIWGTSFWGVLTLSSRALAPGSEDAEKIHPVAADIQLRLQALQRLLHQRLHLSVHDDVEVLERKSFGFPQDRGVLVLVDEDPGPGGVAVGVPGIGELFSDGSKLHRSIEYLLYSLGVPRDAHDINLRSDVRPQPSLCARQRPMGETQAVPVLHRLQLLHGLHRFRRPRSSTDGGESAWPAAAAFSSRTFSVQRWKPVCPLDGIM